MCACPSSDSYHVPDKMFKALKLVLKYKQCNYHYNTFPKKNFENLITEQGEPSPIELPRVTQ